MLKYFEDIGLKNVLFKCGYQKMFKKIFGSHYISTGQHWYLEKKLEFIEWF